MSFIVWRCFDDDNDDCQLLCLYKQNYPGNKSCMHARMKVCLLVILYTIQMALKWIIIVIILYAYIGIHMEHWAICEKRKVDFGFHKRENEYLRGTHDEGIFTILLPLPFVWKYCCECFEAWKIPSECTKFDTSFCVRWDTFSIDSR